jgi:hypothetical protein
VLTVTPSNLQIVRGIGRFVRTRTYYADLVEGIAVGKTNGRYCVRISYRGVDVDFGAGMSKQEATEIAAAALARIRPQSWWSASEDPPASITADEEPAESKSSARVGRKALLPVGVIAALAWLAVETLKPTPKRAQVTSAPYLRPDPRYLSTPRLYAIAMTSWALTSGHSALIGRPSCDANATWKHWSCRARATTATGVVVAYRCESDSASTGGMTCWVLKPQSPIAQEP